MGLGQSQLRSRRQVLGSAGPCSNDVLGSRRDLFRQVGWAVACAAIGHVVSGFATFADERIRSSRVTVSIADFGAVGDGKTDNQAAIQRAFDYAKTNGVSVLIPAGTFLHSGTLTADSIKVYGAGETSILKATQYSREAIWLQGTGTSLDSVHLIGVGGARTADYNASGVVVTAQNFSITNVHIDNPSNVGIEMDRAGYGRIAGNL